MSAMNSLAQKSVSDDDGFDLKTPLYLLLDHGSLIAYVALIFVLAGIVFALRVRPTYESNILIQVEDNLQKKAFGEAFSIFEAKTAASSEVEILRSRAVVSRAVDYLQLYNSVRPKYLPIFGAWIAAHNRKLSTPGLFGYGGYVWGSEDIVVSNFQVPDALRDHEFTLTVQDDGWYLINAGRNGAALKGRIGAEFRTSVSTGYIELQVDRFFARPGAQFLLRSSSRLEAIETLQRSLIIAEKGKQSDLIEITLRGQYPELIRKTLNEIGDEYVRQNMEQKSAETERTLDFVDKQLISLKQKVDQADSRLQVFRHANGTINLAEESKQLLQRSLNVEIKLGELKQKREELLIRFTIEHPAVVGIDRQIDEVNSEISTIALQIRKIPLLEQESLRLTRDVKLNSDLYTLLLNNEQQLNLFKANKISNVRMIDSAIVPEQPLKSNRSMIVAIALMLGLAVGMGLAFVKKILFDGLRDTHEITQIAGMTVCARIPHSQQQELLSEQMIAQSTRISLLAKIDPSDNAIEALRSYRASLLLSLQNAENNIVIIAAPTPKLGKSFVSVNFAALLAAAGKKVMLIDADLRQGHLHQYFGLTHASSLGLSEAIAGSCSLEQSVHYGVLENLDFIGNGVVPKNPSELLCHDNTDRFLKLLSESYDFVLIAAPPVLAVSDALILGARAAALYLVVRAGKSTLKDVEQSIENLAAVGIHTKGVIFNGIKKRMRSIWL